MDDSRRTMGALMINCRRVEERGREGNRVGKGGVEGGNGVRKGGVEGGNKVGKGVEWWEQDRKKGS